MPNPPETPSPPDPNTPPGKGQPPARRPIPPGFLIAIVVFVILFMVFGPMFDRTPEINYGFFRQQLEAGNVASLDLQGMKVIGEFVNPPPDPTGKTDRSGNAAILDKKFATTIPAIVNPEKSTI